MSNIRPCRDDEGQTVLNIINEAAEIYRDAIPREHWHDPYMSRNELEREIEAGVRFLGFQESSSLVGVMGVQSVQDVDLIRHAYVRPTHQGRGIGGKLLETHRSKSTRPMFIGTWTTASWAIRFYQRHGFKLVPGEEARHLLRTYWAISDRQMQASVVLADQRALDTLDARRGTLHLPSQLIRETAASVN